MSSLRVALVACANGLGHTRRMLSLSLALHARGASPVLFAPKNVVDRLALNYSVKPPAVINFQSKTTRNDWLEPDNGCWTANLPSLDNFDEIVSDNLVEILALYPRAWISGSFFWHMALPNFPPQKAARAEQLLEEHRPRMISTDLFAAPYLSKKTSLITVGLYALGSIDQITEKRDLLISCGKGGGAEMATSSLLREIATSVPPGNFTIWVEPTLYRSEMPIWMKPASFTPTMYGRLLAAVIRPSIGTVTDTLLAGARLFMFYEPDNLEMPYNAQRIANAGLGSVFSKPKDAYKAGISFLLDQNKQMKQKTSLLALNKTGADQAADILLTNRKKGMSTLAKN